MPLPSALSRPFRRSRGSASTASSSASFASASTTATATTVSFADSLTSRPLARPSRAAPHALIALRGAPGEDAELLSLGADAGRVGGVRFADEGEPGPPGRLVRGDRQLLVLRDDGKRGEGWELTGRVNSGGPVASALKAPGRRRFLVRVACGEGRWEEFVVDGESRRRRVTVYFRGETGRIGGGDEVVGTVCWGRWHGRRGAEGGLVRVDRPLEVETLLFCVWLAMLLWRKRPVGGGADGGGKVKHVAGGAGETQVGF